MVVTFSSHSFRLASAFLIAITACSPGLPGPSGARPAAVRSDTLWTPPARRARDSLPNSVPLDLPPDLVARRTALSLEDVVALALEGSPDTRASWAAARASAAGLGAARGAWFPEITGDASATRIKTAATQGRTAVQQTLYEPSVSFTWLLLDVGGRTGQISVARNALISANWTHNATLQSVVARAAAAYFDYAAAKALLTAQQATVNEAGEESGVGGRASPGGSRPPLLTYFKPAPHSRRLGWICKRSREVCSPRAARWPRRPATRRHSSSTSIPWQSKRRSPLYPHRWTR